MFFPTAIQILTLLSWFSRHMQSSRWYCVPICEYVFGEFGRGVLLVYFVETTKLGVRFVANYNVDYIRHNITNCCCMHGTPARDDKSTAARNAGRWRGVRQVGVYCRPKYCKTYIKNSCNY